MVEHPTSPPMEPKRKISMFQIAVQKDLQGHASKCGKAKHTNKIRHDNILGRGTIAHGVYYLIMELEKAHRQETEKNSAEVIYEILRLCNEIPDVSIMKIIKLVRKKDLQASDFDEKTRLPAPPPNGPEVASLNKLIRVLRCYGILIDDPRLAETLERQKKLEDFLEENEMPTNPLSKDNFMICVYPIVEMISRAFRNDLEIPEWDDFTHKVTRIFYETRRDDTGAVASYIPQLARQDPELYGLSICTVDGSRFNLGDSKVPFCLQSVSKAFTYAIVSNEIGNDAIHEYIGYEPSGRLFNEICLDSENKPHNPMINAGAIIVTSMIKNDWPMADRFDFIIERYREIAGTFPVEFNNATFISERNTADRNYALAYFMKENKCFPPRKQTLKLGEELELYFQLCSLECNCETLSVMAATLANGGVNPLTYARVLSPEACRDTLSLMFSCGMYDLSGRFAFQVGIPAKSGVSGAIMVVIPSVLGMCIFSPRLDEMGNSSRGVAFCKNFEKKFAFHNYDHLNGLDLDEKPEEKGEIKAERKIGIRKEEKKEIKVEPPKAIEKNDKYKDLLPEEVEEEIMEIQPKIKKDDPRKPDAMDIRAVFTNMMVAVKNNNLDLIQQYFMLNVDLEMEDYDYRTPLHLAASEGHIEIVDFLVSKAGVDHSPIDRWGHTPIEDAIRFGHEEVEQCLFNHIQRDLEESDTEDEDEEYESDDAMGRTRRATVVEVDPSHLQRRLSLAPVSPQQAPQQPTLPMDILHSPSSAPTMKVVSSSSSTSTKSSEVSSVSNAVPKSVCVEPTPSKPLVKSDLDLPPMITRPSQHGLKR